MKLKVTSLSKPFWFGATTKNGLTRICADYKYTRMGNKSVLPKGVAVSYLMGKY
jgi:hypothetical protein